MHMNLGEKVFFLGQEYRLAGPLLTKLPPLKNTAIPELSGWQMCGGVYKVPRPVIRIKDVIFVPWLIPPPRVFTDGSVGIELIAQVGKDIAEPVSSFDRIPGDEHRVGEIRMQMIMKRSASAGTVIRTQTFGHVYTTADKQQFRIWLTAIPFSVMVYTGKIQQASPAMVMIPEVPRALFNRQRRKRDQRKSDMRDILNGGS